MKALWLTAAVLGLGVAAPALAGGRLAGTCPAGHALAFDNRGNGTCERYASGPARSGTSAQESAVTGRGAVLLCPYPHRPSDSVFLGGSGYVLKDDVRRANRC